MYSSGVMANLCRPPTISCVSKTRYGGSVSVGVTNNLQDHEEEVDDVHVETQCSKDVLLR